MHILGKILIFVFLIPAAGASVWLTARLHLVRNSWSQKAESLVKQIDENEAKIATRSAIWKQKKAELAQLRLAWDTHWTDIDANGRLDNGKPILNAQVGSNQQLRGAGGSQQPVLYVFRPSPDGNGSVYLGAFSATSVQAARSALEPTWKYRPTDQIDLSPGKWRFRAMIPAGYSNRISDFHDRLTSGDLTLRDLQLDLEMQKKQAAIAVERLNTRLGELIGDPNAKEIPGRLEFSKGLVKANEEEQTQRNQTLDQLDIRRREVKAEYERMISLIKENQSLSKTLSAGTPAATSALSKK